MTNDNVEVICHDCIGDSYLKGEICALQDQHRCARCGKEELCIALSDLAERVHSVFHAHYFQTLEEPDEDDRQRILSARHCEELYWEREGDSINDIFQHILGIEPELADAIRSYLSDRYDASHREIASGNLEEQPYADSALYVEMFPGAGPFRQALIINPPKTKR